MLRILSRPLRLFPRDSLFSPGFKSRFNYANRDNSPSLVSLSLSSSTYLHFENPNSEILTNQDQPQKKESEEDDVTTEELRKRIGKYFEGDDDAIPSIFEAILKRKLVGKHDESDDELLNEFGPKLQDDLSGKDFDSD